MCLQHQIISTHSYILPEYLVAQVVSDSPACYQSPLPLLYVEFFNFSNVHFVVVDSVCPHPGLGDVSCAVLEKK